MDEFFRSESITDRGTLFHLKQLLGKGQVSGQVSSHFTSDWEFMAVSCVLLIVKMAIVPTSISVHCRSLYHPSGIAPFWC
jgi:hypothetical protein